MRRALCLGIIVCAGCAGGQTGEESSFFCVDKPAAALSLEEVSPLGFTANEVLELAQGEKRSALRWIRTEGYNYGPESGTGVLVVTVTSLGSAGYVDVVPREASADGIEPSTDALCKPRVEVDVQVSVRTEGGALNEQFEAKLVAEHAGSSALTHDLDIGKLGGSFAFEPLTDENERLYKFNLQAKYSPQTFSGMLTAYFERSEGSGDEGSVSLRNVPVACWQSASMLGCD